MTSPKRNPFMPAEDPRYMRCQICKKPLGRHSRRPLCGKCWWREFIDTEPNTINKFNDVLLGREQSDEERLVEDFASEPRARKSRPWDGILRTSPLWARNT